MRYLIAIIIVLLLVGTASAGMFIQKFSSEEQTETGGMTIMLNTGDTITLQANDKIIL